MENFKLSFVLVLAWCTLLQVYVKADDRPNIIFVLADDLGYYDVGYHGDTVNTPNIDSLASEGITLENYYVQQSCTPTRSQLLTGRYQIHFGMQHGYIWMTQANGLPLDEVTIADKMKDAGYATHMVGKWHLGFFQSDYMPHYRGFDTFLGFMGGYVDYYDQTSPYDSIDYLDFRNQYGPVDTWSAGTYSAQVYTNNVLGIIKTHQTARDGPLFLYFASQVPHAPLDVPKEYKKQYWNVSDDDRKTYLGMVTFLDDTIGSIVQVLKDKGMWDNTLIVFSSDNGAEVSNGGNNWPLRGVKDTLWEGALHAVSFVSGGYLTKNLGDGVVPGQSTKELFHVTDWFPTLVKLGGGNLTGTNPLDGFDQWDTITKNAASDRTEILHNIDEDAEVHGTRLYNWTFDNTIQAAVRVGDYKLITGGPGDGSWYAPPERDDLEDTDDPSPPPKNIWLFNIAEDPQEETDLSQDMPEKVIELLNKLADYQAGAVPSYNPDTDDPRSNPALHGDVWSPWLDDDDYSDQSPPFRYHTPKKGLSRKGPGFKRN